MNVASPDRRIATGVVAIVAMVLAIVIAGTPKPQRSQDAILRDVVQLLARGDQQDARVQYTNVRVAGNGRRTENAVTTWFRTKPYTRLLLAGDLLQIETDTISAQCVGSNSIDNVVAKNTADGAGDQRAAAVTCLPRDRTTNRDSSEGFFVAVRVRRAYTVSDLGTQKLVGEPARCFRFAVAPHHDPIAQLGNRTDLCLSERGVLLRSEVETSGRRDERTATAVRYGVDASELDRVVARHASS